MVVVVTGVMTKNSSNCGVLITMVIVQADFQAVRNLASKALPTRIVGKRFLALF